MLLYEHPLSSYAQKVKIALREKGVTLTAELAQSLGSSPSPRYRAGAEGSARRGSFAASNPRMEVPVLIDGDTRIFDSTVIMDLADWHRRVSERPAVAATFAEFDAAAARMKGMADIYSSGERRREYRDHRLEWMVKSGGIDVVLNGIRDRNIPFSWPDAS